MDGDTVLPAGEYQFISAVTGEVNQVTHPHTYPGGVIIGCNYEGVNGSPTENITFQLSSGYGINSTSQQFFYVPSRTAQDNLWKGATCTSNNPSNCEFTYSVCSSQQLSWASCSY